MEQRNRTCFLGDITDLLAQLSLMSGLLLEFLLLSHTFPHCLRQLGFLFLAAKVILVDT